MLCKCPAKQKLSQSQPDGIMLHKIIDASIHLHGYLQEQLTQPVIHIISLLFNGPAFRLNSKRSIAFLDIRDHSTFLCQCARPFCSNLGIRSMGRYACTSRLSHGTIGSLPPRPSCWGMGKQNRVNFSLSLAPNRSNIIGQNQVSKITCTILGWRDNSVLIHKFLRLKMLAFMMFRWLAMLRQKILI